MEDFIQKSKRQSTYCMHAQLLQSGHTLCDPMDCSPPGSSVQGSSRQEYWSGLPHPPPGHPPRPGVKPTTPMSPAFASGFFTTVPFPKRVSEKGSDSNYTKRPF